AMYLNNKGQEHLKSIGVGEQDIQTITDFAQKLESGDKEALEYAVNGRNPIRSAIVAAGLLEQTKSEAGKTYWNDRMDGMAAARETIKTAERDHKREDATSEPAEAEKSTPLSADERSKKWTPDTPEASFVERDKQRKAKDSS